MAEKSVISLI